MAVPANVELAVGGADGLGLVPSLQKDIDRKPVRLVDLKLAVQYQPGVFSSMATTRLLVPSQKKGVGKVMVNQPVPEGKTVPLYTIVNADRGTQSVVPEKVDLVVLPKYTTQSLQEEEKLEGIMEAASKLIELMKPGVPDGAPAATISEAR